MKNEDWLNELKVGDQVCYHNPWHGYLFEKIIRVTPTGRIKTDRGNVFKNGRCDGYRLLPITRIILDAVRKSHLIRELRDFEINKLSLNKLERIAIILEESI